MLRIVQNLSAVSAKSYYSHAEYYGESQELAGRWGGKAARMLGLEGRIDQRDFDALCDNIDPRSGEALTARTNGRRTVGYDFNFHVPKGLSLAYAFGDDRIAYVFEQVVSDTMQEIESEAKTRVRVSGRQDNRLTSNLLWGQFIHKTARPIGGEPDPHLHAHCFVFNATYDRDEERFKAVQFRELKRDGEYFAARFHARLAQHVKDELGYDIRRRGRHWDIAALPETLTRKFSRRTTQIEQEARDRGVTTAEEKAELGAATRESKSKHQTMQELREVWRGRMTGKERELIDKLPGLTKTEGGIVVGEGPTNTAEAVKQGILHCFEREAVVPERQVLTEALRVGVGHIDVAATQAEASRQGMITREVDGLRLATTPEVLKEERRALEFARGGKNQNTPLNAAWQTDTEWLSDEQKAAIERLVTSRDRVQLILGGAGTGKTTLMTEAARAIQAGGHQVATFAPSAKASRDVLRREGFENATTVAELLVNEKLHDGLRHQVIWIDEAGLLGTRQLKRVFELADRLDARLILSGDWKRQHGSVDRGGVLGLLDRYAGITPIQINTIRRQQGRYKEAIACMAAGNIMTGFDELNALGWVHEIDDGIRNEQIAKDFADVVAAGKSALVVSPTHREADQLTEAIRSELRERDTIKGTDHTVASLEPLHRTEAERSDPAFYQPGDVIIFHQNAKGFTKGDRLHVEGGVPRAVLEQAQRFSVYRPSTIQLATGDRVRITTGGKTKDGKHRLNNGSVFEVAKINEDGDIQLGNGWVIDARFGHLANGFVTTSHGSQGDTVDHVLIAESAESFPAASREQFYVSASRGRKSARIYTDSKADLRDVIQSSSANVTASEVVLPEHLQHERHRRQQRAAVHRGLENERSLDRELAYER